MATNEQQILDEALWKTISFEEQVEIDMAVDRGEKPLAVNMCMCSGKGFTVLSAKRVVEQRAVELKRRHIPKK